MFVSSKAVALIVQLVVVQRVSGASSWIDQHTPGNRLTMTEGGERRGLQSRSKRPTIKPVAPSPSAPIQMPTTQGVTSPMAVPPSQPSPSAPIQMPTTPVAPTPIAAPVSSLVGSQCSAYPVCQGLNLTGDCCPAANGVWLDCCNGTAMTPTKQPTRKPSVPSASTPTKPPTKKPTTPSATAPNAAPFASANSQQCSAYPICQGLNLTGNCCPANNGVELYCCNEVESNCQDNPACVLANLTGACCPTETGEFLGCCRRTTNNCAANANCKHLVGDCCPTEAGVWLDCCNGTKPVTNGTNPVTNGTNPVTNGTNPSTNGTNPATNGTNPVTNGTNPVQASCSSHPKCEGLAGACCPTTDNVFLFCCEKYRDSCVTHSKCMALGLQGQCCPTQNGTYLGCCEREFAACNVHPKCAAAGKQGNCCPNDAGKFDGCCQNDTLVQSLEFKEVPRSEAITDGSTSGVGGKNIMVALSMVALVTFL